MKYVMQAVSELVELLPGDGYQHVINPWQEDLLVLAAAWHDAGFNEEAAQAYPTKEEYMESLRKYFQALGIAEDEIQKRLDTPTSHRKRIMKKANPWLERQNNQ